MRTLVKIAVLVCFLLTLAYSAIPSPVRGNEVPPAPKREMARGRALQPRENPGEPLAGIPPATAQLACLGAMENSLPLPTSVAPSKFVDFEMNISYLQTEYKKLNWCVDKGVRDTGPSFQGTYYGTHPAVRVFIPQGHAMAHRRPQRFHPGWRHDHQGALPTVGEVVCGSARRSVAQSDRLDSHDQGFEGLKRWLVLGRVL
jgi:hypothetical protein